MVVTTGTRPGDLMIIRDIRAFYLFIPIFYIFLLYCPPTSNKALVICPKEQTLVTSIKLLKNIFIVNGCFLKSL